VPGLHGGNAAFFVDSLQSLCYVTVVSAMPHEPVPRLGGGPLDLAKTPWNTMRIFAEATEKEMRSLEPRPAPGVLDRRGIGLIKGQSVSLAGLRTSQQLNDNSATVVSRCADKNGFMTVSVNDILNGSKTIKVQPHCLMGGSYSRPEYHPSIPFKPPAGDLDGTVSIMLRKRFTGNGLLTSSTGLALKQNGVQRVDPDCVSLKSVSSCGRLSSGRVPSKPRSKHASEISFSVPGTSAAGADAAEKPFVSNDLLRLRKSGVIPAFPTELKKSWTGTWQVSQRGKLPIGWAGCRG